MARPQKTGMDYFPHDTDACNDEKVELLRMLYGNDGYAFYFIMLERIYRTKCGELKIVSEAETDRNEIIYDEETIIILSKKIQISLELFKKILKTCLKRNIFSQKMLTEKGVITSSGIKKRMKPILKKRSNMLKKYNKTKIVSDAETPQESGSNSEETPQKPDKEKERKEEERKVKNRKEFKSFWDMYDKKTGDKKKIEKKFSKLSDEKKSLIFDHIPKYKNSQPDKKFRKNPETYLNNSSWLDEIIDNNSNNGGIKHDGFTKEDYEDNGLEPDFL